MIELPEPFTLTEKISVSVDRTVSESELKTEGSWIVTEEVDIEIDCRALTDEFVIHWLCIGEGNPRPNPDMLVVTHWKSGLGILSINIGDDINQVSLFLRLKQLETFAQKLSRYECWKFTRLDELSQQMRQDMVQIIQDNAPFGQYNLHKKADGGVCA